MTCDRLRGHWGGQGDHHGCACPIPPDSLSARIGPTATERAELLLARLSVGTLDAADTVELVGMAR